MYRKIPGTERVYRPSMLPQEIAELSLGLTESSDQTKNFEIQNIELADVADYDGYRARAVYVDPVGLRKRLEIVGAPIQNYVCELIYIAADEVYFDRYYEIFADVVSSARVKRR